MAIFHLHQQVITKGQGRSIVAAAAYRSGSVLAEQIVDKDTGVIQTMVHDYTRKGNVAYNEIFAPSNAPSWVYDRAELWNRVSAIETRKDAQFAKEIDLALPVELDLEQSIELLRDFVDECFVKKGMVADVNIHWEEGNPHSHILLTTRSLSEEGFGLKNRDWNSKVFLLSMRELWAEKVNLTLRKLGIDQVIDHRSFKEAGVDLVATIHEGVASKLDSYTDRVAQNKFIREENARRIIDNPENVIELVSIKYNIFSKAEVAKEVFGILEASGKYPSEEYLQPILDKIFGSERVVKVTDKSLDNEALFSTNEKQLLEKTLFDNIEQLKGKSDHGVSLEVASPALNHLSGSEGVAALIGRAGTGKSSLIAELASIYNAKGYKVYGGAVSGIATDNLAKVCAKNKVGGQFRTLASWRTISEQNKEILFDKKGLFILDEASMLDISDLKFLSDQALVSGAKLIMVGDPDQLQPIGLGDGFRAIADKIGYYELDQVWRQKEQWQKDATMQLANGHVREAYNGYETNGRIKPLFLTREQARNDLIQDYVGDYGKESNSCSNTSSIILTYRRAEVDQINQQVREYLKQAGLIVEIEGAKFRTQQGLIELGKGEEIIFTKNHTALGIYNGTRGVVEKVSVGSDFHGIITIRLNDGNGNLDKSTVSINTKEYNYINYGYATTIHKAQGLTVDKAYLLADRYMNHNSFYVAASRHRNDIGVYLDKETFNDKEAAIRCFERSYSSRNLIVDYEINENNKKYYDLVQSYKEAKESVVKLYEYVSTNALEQNQSFAAQESYPLFLEKVTQRNKLAKEIWSDYKNHHIYLRQAGIYKSALEKHAGVLVKEKSRSMDVVGKYLENIKELSLLGKTMTEYKSGKQIDSFDVNLRAFERDKMALTAEAQDLAFYLHNNKHLVREGINAKTLEDNVAGFIARAYSQYKTNTNINYIDKSAQKDLSLPQMYAVIGKLNAGDKQRAEVALEFGKTYEQLAKQKDALTLKLTQLSKQLSSLDNTISNSLYKRDLTVEYLTKIYQKPNEALDRWKDLIKEHASNNKGIETAKVIVREDITALGELRGKEYLWVLKDSSRKQAQELGQTLVNKLEKDYQSTLEKNDAIATKAKLLEQNNPEALQKQLNAINNRIGWIGDNERVLREVSNIALNNLHKGKEQSASEGHQNKETAINYVGLDKQAKQTKEEINKLQGDIHNLARVNGHIEIMCKKAFTTSFANVIDNWETLVKEHGQNKAISLVQDSPTMLGSLNGQTKMFGLADDPLRKQTKELVVSIGVDLAKYQNNVVKTAELEYRSRSIKDNLLRLDVNKENSKEEISRQVYISLYKEVKLKDGLDSTMKNFYDDLKAKAEIIADYVKYERSTNEDIKTKLTVYNERYRVEQKSYEIEIYDRLTTLIEKKGEKAITFENYANIHKVTCLYARLQGRMFQEQQKLSSSDVVNMELQKIYKAATAISKKIIEQNNLDTNQYKLPIREIIAEFMINAGKKPDATITDHIVEAAKTRAGLTKPIEIPTTTLKQTEIRLIDEHRQKITKHITAELGYKLFEGSIESKTIKDLDIKEIVTTLTRQAIIAVKVFDKEITKIYSKEIEKDF